MGENPAPTLVVESGIPGKDVLHIVQPTCVLGKSRDADITLENPYVSRRHAEILADRGQYFVRDLGSKNGTFSNGERLDSERRQLRSGDRLVLGRGQVVLKFQEPGATLTLMGVNDLIVDFKAREVWFQGSLLGLTPKEYSLLEHLYLHRGDACSKDSLALAGWPERDEGQVADQDIEQVIRRLRRRLEPNPSQPQYILTVKGYGYKLSSR
jgi:hypothetical protein